MTRNKERKLTKKKVTRHEGSCGLVAGVEYQDKTGGKIVKQVRLHPDRKGGSGPAVVSMEISRRFSQGKESPGS